MMNTSESNIRLEYNKPSLSLFASVSDHSYLSSPLLWLSYPSSSPTPLPPPLSRLPSPAPSSSASKIDSLRSKVDLLKLPLALSTKSISERKSQLGGVGEQRGTGGGGGARKARSPPTRDMDNESQYSGYSYKSSHSRSSRKHRWVTQGHTQMVHNITLTSSFVCWQTFCEFFLCVCFHCWGAKEVTHLQNRS